MKIIEGNIAAPEARVAIVVARFNSFINDSLVNGARYAHQGQIALLDLTLTLQHVQRAVHQAVIDEAVETGNDNSNTRLGTRNKCWIFEGNKWNCFI